MIFSLKIIVKEPVETDSKPQQLKRKTLGTSQLYSSRAARIIVNSSIHNHAGCFFTNSHNRINLTQKKVILMLTLIKQSICGALFCKN